MKHVLVLVTVVALGSCTFGQKHPGVTIGAATGSMAFVMCGIEVEEGGTCAAVGGLAGLAIGGITGLVTMLADTTDHTFDEPAPPIMHRRQVEEPPGPYLPPEPNAVPVMIDAGVVDAAPVDAPPGDAPPADAAPHD
jgi:hypothetical protein